MSADICVVHDCDLDKLKEMGLEFIRYTRPVDQFDRVSLTRQDRFPNKHLSIYEVTELW